MSIVCESDLLSAAGYLCHAADNLRAIGLLTLAQQIESFIAALDVEILLRTASSTDDPPPEQRSLTRRAGTSRERTSRPARSAPRSSARSAPRSSV